MTDGRFTLQIASILSASLSNHVTDDDTNYDAAPASSTRLDSSLSSDHLAIRRRRCHFELDRLNFDGKIWIGCRGIEYRRET
jgi:hypothetical protein